MAATEERYGTLFETLPHGVIQCSADGTIIGANPAAAEILGLSAEEMTTWPVDWAGRAVDQEGSPFRQDELPVMRALRRREIVADVVIGLPHRRTGELRWLRVTAVPDTLDEQGRLQCAYAMFTDITEQHRAEAALRRSNRLLGRLRSANVLGVVVASEKGLHEVNDAFLDIIGYTATTSDPGPSPGGRSRLRSGPQATTRLWTNCAARGRANRTRRSTCIGMDIGCLA
jgi:PAS domain S-box-containing protein